MTATMTDTPPPAAPKADSGRSRSGRSVGRILTILAGGLILVALVRVITGADQLTSEGQVSAALGLAVPIGLAGLAGLWSERSGVVNIGLEGMMILGTFGAGWIGWQTNPWLGLLCGIGFGVLGGLVHAVATVTFGVDHIVSGVAVNLLALGTTQYLAKLFFSEGKAADAGGNPKQSPPVDSLPTFDFPGLSDALKSVENHHWFVISDLAGILGGLVTDLSVVTILAVVLFVASGWLLWRTPFGLRLRSCGENPIAAESLGVNVYRYKYMAVAISGGLAGLGGAFLALVTSHTYLENQTGGRGYIGLAAMIFGNWRPGGLAMGAGLFGYSDALQLRNGGQTVHALLLLLVVLLAGLAGWKLYKKAHWQAGISLIVTALVLLWYLFTDEVPSDFVGATPYVVTLLVLSLSAQRLRMPKADGMRYRKGQGK
ncbi:MULTISPECIES: ABC transporter permease [unclassified Streptomyces]|uniref:ABC transporter permease n=1 Tax=unclassified Streptomyces TaxID=2593676 RepID=UPI0022584992|nr:MULTISPECIES: ABC transporter permease [unclassified Streptomyces]MCX5050619.1 ABC transporter permease [Streptomyces sp. NBC_00474]MCX5060997.1 ABC transporter permease [Streptomyces sp. NBC_00452]MCX5248527.1 ABC transporter permease [Streptomyces sp. NBC_00201]MCX5293378.1 ABC transporter permease [Streptomyces sp. NBC_00183]